SGARRLWAVRESNSGREFRRWPDQRVRSGNGAVAWRTIGREPPSDHQPRALVVDLQRRRGNHRAGGWSGYPVYYGWVVRSDPRERWSVREDLASSVSLPNDS